MFLEKDPDRKINSPIAKSTISSIGIMVGCFLPWIHIDEEVLIDLLAIVSLTREGSFITLVFSAAIFFSCVGPMVNIFQDESSIIDTYNRWHSILMFFVCWLFIMETGSDFLDVAGIGFYLVLCLSATLFLQSLGSTMMEHIRSDKG